MKENHYLYFFDIDDTICNTKELVKDILSKNQTPNVSHHEFNKWLEQKINDYGVENIPILDNSIVAILKNLIKTQPKNVYYITARGSEVREGTSKWLKKHNLWLEEDKLIMDTQGIKGFTINKILQMKNIEFAFLFDDLKENHEEAAKYNKIISCLPY